MVLYHFIAFQSLPSLNWFNNLESGEDSTEICVSNRHNLDFKNLQKSDLNVNHKKQQWISAEC